MSNNYPQLKYGIGVRPKQDLKDKRKRGRYFWQFDYVGHKRHIYVTCPNCGKVNDISKHEIDSNGKSKQVRTSWDGKSESVSLAGGVTGTSGLVFWLGRAGPRNIRRSRNLRTGRLLETPQRPSYNPVVVLKEPARGILRGLASLALFSGGLLALRELLHYVKWTQKGKEVFRRALQAAKRLKKPLLVVGRPILKGHGCGDVCYDLVGCPECPVGIKGDIRNMYRFEDRQFGAAFVGEVVECLGDDMQQALDELYRVADEVYIAHLPDDSLTAWHFPGIHSVIHSAPPETPYLDYTVIATGQRKKIRPRTWE